MNFPTLFDVLQQFDFLRGEPAAYGALGLAALVVVLRDWRFSVLALLGVYLTTGFLFVDVLDSRLAFVKVVVGLFNCLILYMTARQVNWGRPPEDVTEAEAAALKPVRRVTVGPASLPVGLLLRLGLTAAALGVTFVLARGSAWQLPGLSGASPHLRPAIYGLLLLGAAAMAANREPLPVGKGLLLFLAGFELFYSGLEQSLLLLVALAGLNFVLVLVISYLVQMRYTLPVFVE